MNGTMNEVNLSGSPAADASGVAQPFSTARLLQIWEGGQRQIHVEKALLLLAAAYPDAARDTLAALSIGKRDARLIDLRERLFGPQFNSVVDCPACGERLELNFNTADIRASESPPDAPLSINQSGYDVQLRLPNSLDLLRLTHCQSVSEMRAKLFEQCVVGVTHEGESAKQLEQLPEEIVEVAIDRIGEADPQADVEVDLKCPDCQHAWQTGFDIVSYLWSELQTWAMQLLREVHLLASSYGWRESDILSMSAQRRRCYLELLAG